MDINAIASIVSTVGFPIVCCFGMAYYINTTLKEFTKVMNDHTVALEKLYPLYIVSRETLFTPL